MFTNGLDEEFGLFEQWKDKIFINNNHSYAFIFSKPKSIKKNNLNFYQIFGKNFIIHVK